VGIALILQLMAETGKTVKQLIGEIGSFYMIKDKFNAEPDQVQQILDTAKKTFANAMIRTIDGCRFDFDDGWLHIRPSNTEPVIRIIAEAADKDTAQKYINAILKLGR
jgi:phosphomannomutase